MKNISFMVQFEQFIHTCHKTQKISLVMQTASLHYHITSNALYHETNKITKDFTKMITNPSTNSGSIVISAVLFLLIHDASAIYPGVLAADIIWGEFINGRWFCWITYKEIMIKQLLLLFSVITINCLSFEDWWDH